MDHPLKIERKLRGWSQSRIAEALGTTTRTVSRWEQGLAVPYPYYREQLCVLYGKTAEELRLLSDANENHIAEEATFPVPQHPALAAPATQTSFLVDPTIPESPGST